MVRRTCYNRVPEIFFRSRPDMIGHASKSGRGNVVRAITWTVTLGAYLVAALGLLPSQRDFVRVMGWLAGERYPCEDCGCGCSSAAECWTNCCCHTLQERLEWAIRNGITPPSYVEIPALQWAAARDSIRGAAGARACCAEAGSRHSSAAMRPAPSEPKSCCSGPTCASSEAEPGGSSRATDESTGPFFSALTCKGLSGLCVAGVPVPPPPVVALILLETSPLKYPHRILAAPRSRKLETPTPPPRIA